MKITGLSLDCHVEASHRYQDSNVPYVLGFLAAWSLWVVMDLPAGGQLAKSILKSPCRSGTRAPSGSGRAHDSTACPFHIASQ